MMARVTVSVARGAVRRLDGELHIWCQAAP